MAKRKIDYDEQPGLASETVVKLRGAMRCDEVWHIQSIIDPIAGLKQKRWITYWLLSHLEYQLTLMVHPSSPNMCAFLTSHAPLSAMRQMVAWAEELLEACA